MLYRQDEGNIAVAIVAVANSVSSHAVHALQEGQGDAAVANPGSAYGTSALGPSAGGGGGAAPGTADAQAGTGGDLTPQEPAEDGKAAADGDSKEGQEQPGLSLPFPPVALVFKDIHYFVKRPDNKSEELELLKVVPCMDSVLLAALLVMHSSFSSCALPVLLYLSPAALRLFHVPHLCHTFLLSSPVTCIAALSYTLGAVLVCILDNILGLDRCGSILPCCMSQHDVQRWHTAHPRTVFCDCACVGV